MFQPCVDHLFHPEQIGLEDLFDIVKVSVRCCKATIKRIFKTIPLQIIDTYAEQHRKSWEGRCRKNDLQ